MNLKIFSIKSPKLPILFGLFYSKFPPVFKGAWDMFHKCIKVQDKKVIEFEHSAHQLFMEIPQIREKSLADTLEFIESKIKVEEAEGFHFHDFHYTEMAAAVTSSSN